MVSCRQIVMPLSFVSIYGQFGAIWNPNSGGIVYRIYNLISSNPLSYKN